MTLGVGAFSEAPFSADRVSAGGGGPTYTLTAATGSFTLTGQAANLVVSRKLTAATGSFTLTGQSTNLKVSRNLVAGTGTFSLTGISANLVYTPVSGATYTLTAQTGVFNLTGQAAAFKVSRKLTAETGSFVFGGYPVVFSYSGDVVPTQTKGGAGRAKIKKKRQKLVKREVDETLQQLIDDLIEDRNYQTPQELIEEAVEELKTVAVETQKLEAVNPEVVKALLLVSTLAIRLDLVENQMNQKLEEMAKELQKTNKYAQSLEELIVILNNT